MSDHDATARFEAAATLFYRATGMMAPGKSYPLSVPPPPVDERREAWDQWMLSRSWRDAMNRICDLEARVEDLETALDEALEREANG
jgi:hypothetical protein